MSNIAQEVIETILEKARLIARSETLLGEPIRFNNILVVPVIQISIGFGAGGGEAGKTKNNQDRPDHKTALGVGGAGGIKMEPTCFLVHDGTTVRVLPAKPPRGKGIDALIEKLPDLFSYAMDSIRSRKERDQTNTPETETQDREPVL